MNKALIVVDMQNDFCHPDGALYVGSAAKMIIGTINERISSKEYKYIAVTLDNHPYMHCSFAECFNKKPFVDYIDIDGVKIRLWPRHCVQDTWGAELCDGYRWWAKRPCPFYPKGNHPFKEEFSGFANTRLKRDLDKLDISEVDIVGVATDYCVRATAFSAIRNGLVTNVLWNCTAGVFDQITPQGLQEEFKKAGINVKV